MAYYWYVFLSSGVIPEVHEYNNTFTRKFADAERMATCNGATYDQVDT